MNPESTTFDVAIIGGGPGGVAAGVYAARKKMKTVFITESFGGQSSVSDDIQNWIGTTSIKGGDFALNLKNHLKAYADEVLELHEGEKVKSIKKDGDIFLVETSKDTFKAKTVLITTGSTRKKLDIPGAEQFENKGITYCASCDAPLFGGQDVVVIGGGNAGFESAAQVSTYAKNVTLLNRSENFRADAITVKKLFKIQNVKIITNAVPVEIKGNKFVSSIVYENKKDGSKVELPVSGVFVEIGLIPTTSFAKDLIKLNDHNQIPVDPKTQRTEITGVWAAGDCTDGLYHQNNIAAGDAVKALEDIYMYLFRK